MARPLEREPLGVRRRYVLLGVAITVTYAVLFAASQWLAAAGAVALALTLFIGCGMAAFVLMAYFFRDLLEPRGQRTRNARGDRFMSILAGDGGRARSEKADTGTAGDEE